LLARTQTWLIKNSSLLGAVVVLGFGAKFALQGVGGLGD
jgi:hypothetical protein